MQHMQGIVIIDSQSVPFLHNADQDLTLTGMLQMGYGCTTY